MRKLLLFSLLCSTQFVLARTWNHINPILGDQSYILKYGATPNDFTPDQIRIATHLEYAEYVLRSKDVSEMNAEQIQKRTHILDLLHEYWMRGLFPNNTDETDERRPCFIDHNGTICAVGYLIEQTAGHDVAELINERFMYNEILEMNDPVVINWMEECGLTREECAMIQPGYGDPSPPRFVFSYGGAYRVNDWLYHSFRLQYENDNLRQFRGYGFGNGKPYQSVGIQFDWFYNRDYSVGLRYSRDQLKQYYGNKKLSTAVGVMPEVFVFNREFGLNLKPDIELKRFFGRAITLSASYAYAIPLYNEPAYLTSRHEFSLRVGINLKAVNLPPFPKIPKKPKEDKPADA